MTAGGDPRGAASHPAEIVLLDYLEGDLPGSALDEVHRHVARCRDCRRTLTELAAAVEAIEHLPTARPPLVASAEVRAVPASPALRIARSRAFSVAALVVAAAAVWAAARDVGETAGEAAPRDPVPALAARVAPLGGRLVVDAADAEHVVVLAPDAQLDVVRAAIAKADPGLHVELARLADAAPAQAR